MIIFTFLLTCGLMGVHIFSKRLHFLKSSPRHLFLSFSSGVAVSYVFVHLLPELNEYQKELEDKLQPNFLTVVEDHIYIVAMIGLTIFYVLEVMMRKKGDFANENEEAKSSLQRFQFHMVTFFFYNAVIGYLLVRGGYDGVKETLLFFIAMSVHFITNDWSLRKSHKHVYDRFGRWFLALAIFFGWGVGSFIEMQDVFVSLLTAFLAGAIILNVMKEELPEDHKSNLPAFLVGTLSYTMLLLNI
ncbi:MAG: hypothetical protein ACE3JQ_04940 [Paenisporosarcina sp.]